MRLRTCLLAAVVAGALGLAGCGGDEKETSAPSTTASAVPFDRAFIDAMVPHHMSAIAMSKAAKTAGLSQPDLLEIANAIIVTQQLEIDDMRAWRQMWFGSSEIDPHGADALGLSEEEMGMQHEPGDFGDVEDVNQAFAAMMIDHHRGAIRMAELGRERGEHQETQDLAEQIIRAQKREIELLEPHAAGEHG